MKQILTTLTTLSLLAAPALARPPIPEAHWDEPTKLTLARAMVGEADWHTPDHVAIAWVLQRRWKIHSENRKQIPFKRFIQMYSSPLKAKTDRAEWVQSLPWGPMPGPYEQRWDRVRRTVRRWGAGRIQDPCPKALHWGGTMDRPSGHWYPVSCGRTRNIFYSVRPRERSHG